MKRFAILFVFSLFQTHLVNAQQFKEADPSTIGLLPDRLDRIDTIILKAIEKREIPGAVVLIARNGKIGYHKSFGHADIALKKNGKRIHLPHRIHDQSRHNGWRHDLIRTRTFQTWRSHLKLHL